ncbi:uncharacterized protein [Euwallacea fornicatus]|uniref:uncharacterized protein n=1 Tax=Euwallacea fornicatus TaxID=995702 RepID=UPI00338D3FD2
MNDIFNGDETGLFYKTTPNKTLKFKGEKCAGGKQSKERITVWVCANMTGTEKRLLMVIEFQQEELVDQDDEEDISLTEWIKKHSNIDLEEYTKIDNDLVKTNFPSDAELMNNVKELLTDEIKESENEEEKEPDDDAMPIVSQTLSSLNVVSKFIHCTSADSSIEVRLCGVRPYWGVVNIAEALGASETPGNFMETQESKLGVPSGNKGAVAKTILKERRDVIGRGNMPLVRKGSVPESLMSKEEVEGAELGFARRGKVQRTQPKDKGGETEENVKKCQTWHQKGRGRGWMNPLWEEKKRMDESIVGGEEEGLRALLEVAREQVGDVVRILKESYHPKQELVDVVSVLKSTIRSMVLEEERKGQENRKLEEENKRLRDEVARLRAGKREGVSVECQTETEEERKNVEVKKRLTTLAREGKILEAIKERWDNGIFEAIEIARGDPISEGFRMDLAVLVDKGYSALKERLLQFLPELKELETEEGRIASLVQTCNLRKRGKVVTKTKHVYFQELESTGPVGVFEALKVLAATMLEEGRDSVSIPLVPGADPWQLRKVCELACWTQKENIRVKLYLPGGTSSGRKAVHGPGPKRPEEDVVFVAKQERVSYSDTLRKVRKLVANSQTKVDIATVRETKKGEVLITLPKGGEQREELKNILGKGMGEGNVRSGVNSKIVVFQLTGLDGVTTGEEATGAVATATGLDSKKLRLKGFKASYGSCQTATFLVREGDAESLRVVTDLRVGINMCRLKERKDSGRCYRCWELGHRAQACKGVDSTRLCAPCGKEGHREKDFKDSRYCPLCKAEGHSAGGPNCKGPVKALAGGRGTDPKKTVKPEPGTSKNKDEIGKATEVKSTEQAKSIWTEGELLPTCSNRRSENRTLIPDSDDGAFIWLKSGIRAKSIHRDRGFVAVELGRFTLVSVYFSPNKITCEFEAIINRLDNFVEGMDGRRVVIAGDFNAKCQMFGSGVQNAYGRVLEELVEARELTPHNNGGEWTFGNKNGRSVIDVTMSGAIVARMVRQWQVERDVLRRVGTEADQIVQEIGEACDQCLLKKSGKTEGKKAVYWWNEIVSTYRKECLQARRRMTRMQGARETNEERRAAEDEYGRANKTLEDSILNAKRDAWKKLCDELETHVWGLGYKIVAEKLGRLKPSHLAETNMLKCVDELFPRRDRVRWDRIVVGAEDVERVSAEEVRKAARELGSRKARGLDGIPNEVIKTYLGIKPQGMADCVTNILVTGQFPKMWKRARLVLAEKAKKNPTAEKVINTRLIAEAIERGMLDQNQFGFLKGRSTIDAMRAVMKVVERIKDTRYTHAEFCVMVTIDVKYAFNSAPWDLIVETLKRSQVSNYVVGVVQSYLDERTVQLPNGDVREMSCGVPQAPYCGTSITTNCRS